MFKEVLERIIDDRLEETQANRAHIAISPEEIDRGVDGIAARAKLTVQGLLAEVARQGMTEQDFRDEIGRQILEGKLIELRVRPRVRVTEQDARTTYEQWVRELRSGKPDTSVPTFEAVEKEMMQRALEEGLLRARG